MTNRNQRRKDRNGRRGFVLVTMALTAIVVFGCLGLSVDVGRMYIAKNEAQSYADAAALAGALKLDGTSAGVTAAKTAAIGLADHWNFMTSSFTGTVVEVATTSSGPWTNATSPPSPATGYVYVRVTATAPVSIYFIPVLTGGSLSSTVNARAAAGQIAETTSNEGLFPFSPIAFDGATNGAGAQTSSPWGFVPGSLYTIRYESSGKTECLGDSGDPNHVKIGGSRGFWGDNSTSVIEGQITGSLQEESLTIGEVLPSVNGAKTAAASAIDERIALDTDSTDTTYASYIAGGGNGERLVYMPIQSEVDGTVLGFGTFLLTASGTYDHKGNANWCAIFVGPGVPDGLGSATTASTGVYKVKLVQ